MRCPSGPWLRVVSAALAALVVLPVPTSALRAQGVDPYTGRERGAFGTEPAIPPPVRPVANSRFTDAWRTPLSAPLAGPLREAADRIMVTLQDGRIVALLGSDGTEAWRRELGGPPAGAALTSSPGVVIVVLQDGKIFGLDAGSGAQRWSYDLAEPVAAAPTGTLDEIFVTLRSAKLVCLGKDGAERWRAALSAPPSVPAAACRGFAAVGTTAGTIEAFERQSGRPLWVARTGAEITSGILCRHSALFFGTADNRLWALKNSGRKKWSYPAGARCTARPFTYKDRIYFASYDDYLYALKAGSGNLLLRVRMSHRLSDDIEAAPDRIYLSPYTSGRLAVLSLPDLLLAGEYALDLEGDWFTTPPLRRAGRLFIGYGREEGRVLALNETLEMPKPASP